MRSSVVSVCARRLGSSLRGCGVRHALSSSLAGVRVSSAPVSRLLSLQLLSSHPSLQVWASGETEYARGTLRWGSLFARSFSTVGRTTSTVVTLPTVGQVAEGDGRFHALRPLLEPAAVLPIDLLTGDVRLQLRRGQEKSMLILLAVFFGMCDKVVALRVAQRFASPGMFSGKHTVDLTAENLCTYLLGLQRECVLERRGMIHDEEELAVKLSSREAADETLINVFRTRRASYSSAATVRERDRTLFPIAACIGMSGLGKTRMLEEWERLFEAAGVSKPWKQPACRSRGWEC
jgi:hypothetical protein